MGMRFQPTPQCEPSQIIIHVRMLDKENVQQQEALGIVGVNLVHGALYFKGEHDFIVSLKDNLTCERVEVDMIKFSGPAFTHIDNRLMSLELVQHGLTSAAMFTAQGEVVQAAEVLYKKSHPRRAGQLPPGDERHHRHAGSRAGAVRAGAEGAGEGGHRAHGDDVEKPHDRRRASITRIS